MIIAGHTFAEMPEGRTCGCGRRWTDIAGVTKDAIDKEGWAHSGKLTENEYRQICDERDRLWEIGKGA